ncbi:MAG: WD40 repeat domain-containing protein, partial [Propionicimonas sp.]|nr:WD40 repeat domain-containing protein [Propionicimonas sp.]
LVCVAGGRAAPPAQLVDASRLGEVTGDVDLVLVDQVEDAMLGPADQWEQFLSTLLVLAEHRVVVLALRSDGFARAIEEPSLLESLSRPVLLGPLTRDDLREVITGPAEVAQVSVDDDLVRVLVSELAPGPEGTTVAPDLLPLLSNALLVTWAAGAGQRMTLADYDAAGGISTTVESRAEQVFTSLDPAHQRLAESLFLRLVRVSADVVGREPLPLSSLTGPDREVMDAFVAARMLTVAGDTVRISHDSLLRYWQRLGDWVAGRRGDLVLLERIRRAAAVWEDTGRDPDALLPVQRLAVVGEWLEDPSQQALLSEPEQEFVTASQAHFASVLDAERKTNARLLRQRRVAVNLTAATLVLALVAGIASWRARGFQLDAEQAQAEAQSRQVATMARTLRDRDPNLTAQLARVSTDLAATTEATSMVLDATAVDTPVRWLGEGSAVLAVSPDQQVVARADGAGEVTLWRGGELDTSAGTRFTVDPAGQDLYAVAINQVGGRLLLAVGGIGSRSVWDITGDPTLVVDLADPAHTTYTASFSPDGTRLAFGNETGQVDLLSLAGGTPHPDGSLHLDPLADGSVPAVKAVALSSDGSAYLAGMPGAIAHWKLGAEPVRLPDLTYVFNEQAARAQTLAVSPDGTRLIAGLAGRGVLRWRIDGSQAIAEDPITGFDSYVNDVSFSADGSQFIAGSSDQSTRVYDTATGEELRRLPGPALVTGADFVGDRPVTTGTDGTLRAWQATGPVLRAGGEPVYNLVSDTSGNLLGGGTPSSGIQLWRLDGDQPRQLATPQVELPDGDRQVGAVGLSGDGSLVVGGTAGGRVLSWPLDGQGAGEASVVKVSDAYLSYTPVSPDGSLVAAMEYQGQYTHLLRADGQGRLTKVASLETPIPQLAWFSPDSALLAVAMAADKVGVWSVTDPAAPVLETTIDTTAVPSSVTFASAGRRLAVGLDSGLVEVWDLTTPAEPVKVREYGDPRSGIDATSFSQDGKLLVAASGDDHVWGWDLTSDATAAVFSVEGALGGLWDVRFVRGGTGFAVSGSTGAVKLWDADPSRADDWACAVRGDALTEAEWKRYLPGVEPRDPC